MVYAIHECWVYKNCSNLWGSKKDCCSQTFIGEGIFLIALNLQGYDIMVISEKIWKDIGAPKIEKVIEVQNEI